MVRDNDNLGPRNSSALSEEEAVVAYLQSHPDFMVRHPDLTEILAPPSRFEDSDTISDFNAFMVKHLHERIQQLHDCTEDLLLVTRSNFSTQTRIHKAVLALLDCPDLTAMLMTLIDEVPLLLGVDILVLAVESTPQAQAALWPAEIVWLEPGTVDMVLGGPSVPLRLSADGGGDPEIFGGVADLVASCAVSRLPLGPLETPALIALGSRHAYSFHPHQSSALLLFFCQVVSLAIARWLDSSSVQ